METTTQTAEKINFNINNVALYAKYHYEMGDNIWEDIKKCLIADDYTPYSKMDMLGIISRNVIPIMPNKEDINYFIRNILESIHPNQCWKVGFYTKDHTWAFRLNDDNKERIENLPVYDYETAQLYFFLSYLRMVEIVKLGWDKEKPKANKKVLLLRKNK